MKMLFLDDIREPKNCIDYMQLPIYANSQWEVVRSYDEFVEWIEKNGIPIIVSFDHDLGMEAVLAARAEGQSKRKSRLLKQDEKTGYDCALYLVEQCKKQKVNLPRVLIHTMNPVGKKRIIELLHYAQTSLL